MLALALALIVGQTPGPWLFKQPNLPTGGRVWFEALSEDYAGLPGVQGLCDQLSAAEKTGTYWCLDGAGNMGAGSTVTLSAAGSPTIVSVATCPNGPDCAPTSAIKSASVNSGYMEGSDVDRSSTQSTGSFTACSLFNYADQTSGEQMWSSLATNGSGTWKYMLYTVPGSATFRSYINSGACGVGSTVITGALPIAGSTFGCITWDSADDRYRLWVNGAADTVSAATFTSVCSGGNLSRFVVNGYRNGTIVSSPLNTVGRGSFYTDVALSSDRIAAIARAVLADNPTAARGEALTMARAGLKWCHNSTTGYGTFIPNGRACIGNDGALFVEKLGLNLAVQHEAIDNAAYTKEGSASKVAVVTANDAGTQWGTITGDAVHLFATSGAEYSDVYQAITATGAVPFNVNARVAGARPADGGVAASGTTDICAYDGASWSCTDCAYPAWPAYTTCRHIDLTPTGVNRYFKFGNNSNQNGGVARAERDVILTGVQLEEQAYPTSLMPSGAAQAARVADAPSWAVGTGQVACESAEVMVPGFQAVSLQQRVVGVYWGAGNFYDHYIAAGGTSTQHFTFISSVTRQYAATPALSADAWQRLTYRQDASGGVLSTTINGTTTTSAPGAFSLPASGAVTLYPGKYQTGTYELNGWIRRIQLDPIHTRCRP